MRGRRGDVARRSGMVEGLRAALAVLRALERRPPQSAATRRDLAAATGLHPSRLRRTLAALEALGEVHAAPDPRESGPATQRARVYWLRR